jgi:hypothetical protein
MEGPTTDQTLLVASQGYRCYVPSTKMICYQGSLKAILRQLGIVVFGIFGLSLQQLKTLA